VEDYLLSASVSPSFEILSFLFDKAYRHTESQKEILANRVLCMTRIFNMQQRRKFLKKSDIE
jgi:hypothetical protein